MDVSVELEEQHIISLINKYISSNTIDNLEIHMCKSNSRTGGPQLIFDEVCRYNRLDILKNIYSRFRSDIDIRRYNDYCFTIACARGCLESAQWLLQQMQDAEDKTPVDYLTPFRYSCCNGHVRTAQWLFSLCPSLDVEALEQYALVGATMRNHAETIEWLLPRCPNFRLEHHLEFLRQYDGSGLTLLQKLLSEREKASQRSVSSSEKEPRRAAPRPPIPMPTQKTRNWLW